MWDTTEIQVQMTKLIYGYQVTQICVPTPICPIADHLRNGPLSPAEVARRENVCGRQYVSTHVGDVCQTQSHRSY